MIWLSREVPYAVSSSVKDPEGRYVIIEGELDGRPLTLAAVYAPNAGHAAFFRNLTPALLTDPHRPVIWGGDFNGILDIELDRSSPPLRGAPCHAITTILRDWKVNAARMTYGASNTPTQKNIPSTRQYTSYTPE